MNILNKVISKTSSIRNKKLIEAIPKCIGMHITSNKSFFVKTEINDKYNLLKIKDFDLNKFNKFSKFNMSTSKILKIKIKI